MSEYIKNRNELINELIDNQGFINCQYCKSSTAFKYHTHHIVFRSEKPKHEFIDDKSNLIILCNDCHDDFHSDKSIRNDIVESRRLNEVFGNDILRY